MGSVHQGASMFQKRPSGAGRRIGDGGSGSSLGDLAYTNPYNEQARIRYAERKAERLAIEEARKPSLPGVSILNTDSDIDPADLKAGESAARAAGLS
jgi:hypothetical protein